MTVHSTSLNCFCQCATFPLPLLSAFGVAGNAVLTFGGKINTYHLSVQVFF